MRKLKTTLIGTFITLVMAATPARADCGEVSITEMNWASGAIVTGVSKFLMEQGYGCKVNVVPSATIPAMTSIAESGEPDIATELWVNTAPAYKELVADGKVETLTNVLSDGGVEGWWIPKYLADEHPELKTIEGVLANPKLVGGRFHNCPEGWACRVVNDSLVKAHGVDTAMEVFNHGSGETLASSIASAYSDKAPWFGYYWAPTSILGKYPMVRIDIGPFNEEIHNCNSDKACEKVGKSSYPVSTVVTAATTSFAAREPEIAELMRHVSFSNTVMGEVLAWQEANKASAEEAAVHFLTSNPDLWSGWLSAEASEKLSALLKK